MMAAVKKPRPMLRWHGGKWMLAPWLLSHFPPHRIYTEAFAGAASVLLRKPRAYSEVINDLDGDVVNLFRVLRDPETARELARLLYATPFAREEFEAAYEPTCDALERARRLVVRSFMGFGSAACNPDHATGFRSNSNRSGTTPARDWAHYPESLALTAERLRGVVVECRPAVDVLLAHDGPETLHYVDPPYVHSTRYATALREDIYRHEMSDKDHRELAGVLRGLRGAVVLSGYPCDLYDRELYPDWRRVERAHHADGARDRTEVLWLNALACDGGPCDGGLFAATKKREAME